MGLTEIKGVSGPIDVYEVIGLGAWRSHFELAERQALTKFIGGQQELNKMRGALELAMSGATSRGVAEAGTGKSRLVNEFKATIAPESKVLGLL
jgi:hypothetical protein